jgi:ABC-type transport system involved in cytochrome bd biosynthesis fused ATPase/permease subunit
VALCATGRGLRLSLRLRHDVPYFLQVFLPTSSAAQDILTTLLVLSFFDFDTPTRILHALLFASFLLDIIYASTTNLAIRHPTTTITTSYTAQDDSYDAILSSSASQTCHKV